MPVGACGRCGGQMRRVPNRGGEPPPLPPALVQWVPV